jgi:hypothetical protein
MGRWWQRTVGAQVAAGLILAGLFLVIGFVWQYLPGRLLIAYATASVETPRWLLLGGGVLVLVLAILTVSVARRRLRSAIPPSTPAPSDAKLKTFFYTWADPPGNTAVEILNRLCIQLADRSVPAERYVSILIRSSVIDAQRQSRTQVMDALNSPEEGRSRDYKNGEDQHLLCQYYVLYQSLATWIHQAGELLSLDLNRDQEYKRWRNMDEHFLNQLRALITQPEYRILASGVRGTGWGESVRPL